MTTTVRNYKIIEHEEMRGGMYEPERSIVCITTKIDSTMEDAAEAWINLQNVWNDVIDECDDMINKTNGELNHFELLKQSLNKICNNTKYSWYITDNQTGTIYI